MLLVIMCSTILTITKMWGYGQDTRLWQELVLSSSWQEFFSNSQTTLTIFKAGVACISSLCFGHIVDHSLFDRKPRATVELRWMAHDHRTEFRPRREETFPAQVAAWSAGRTEHERAGGLVSVSGRMAAWHVERGLRASGSWAASRPGARNEFCVSGPWAVFHFQAEFHSEQ
jgi:hypothetical protein